MFILMAFINECEDSCTLLKISLDSCALNNLKFVQFSIFIYQKKSVYFTTGDFPGYGKI